VAAGETRERIIWTAQGLFAARGYADVSTGDIAAAVGVTKATLYYHFRGKPAIYAAVMCALLQAIARGIREIADGPEPVRDRLYRLAEIAMIEVQPNADLDSMMRDAAHHVTAEQLAEIDRAWGTYTGAYEELMRDGIARGELKPLDPRLLAFAFRHLLEAFADRRGTAMGFRGRRSVVGIVVDLFLEGAADRPAG
jgi:TetR/AcrR family transcriptional regulator, mexJK operon transcriptional repressor